MWANRPLEHINDEKLLAFLDGEISRSEARAVGAHLKRCWKCRTALADLESQVEDVSRLLSARSNADAERSARAMKRFLEWKGAFENSKRRFSLRSPRFLKTGQRLVKDWHAQPMNLAQTDSLAGSWCLVAFVRKLPIKTKKSTKKERR